jgi:acetyl-CoA carboxylase biotin carboxylase subunit
MFKKILVANRGEIARRIIIACRELGASPIAVYSEPDAGMPWVRMADESYPLKGAAAADTYLSQEAIFRIGRIAGVDAIHPGYGFLSENPTFAATCAEHNLVFIGPSPSVIRLMGDKAAARELAAKCGVPVVPGLDGAGMADEELAAAAEKLGYPLLVKASAGGGGKGMRTVQSAVELGDALPLARGEALSSFGNDHILIERYLTPIHHIEIQILGDQHGNVLHLFERECSIQRRHQKIIEESPSPALSEALRERMATAAVRLAAAANYHNAGTVEFIVDALGNFYFLEMNTRLQVEHPVTEMVTGVDLAAWQVRLAAGEVLPFRQGDIPLRGHALECRVYAEDPAQGFLPSIGLLTEYVPPSGPGVRVEDGVESGSQVTPYYDPMLAKVITWGQDRQEAIRKMRRALRDTVALGVTTNIPYLLDILDEPDFVAGDTTTDYLSRHFAGWTPDIVVDDDVLLAASVFETLRGGGKAAESREAAVDGEGGQPDPWGALASWRNVRGE